MNQDPLGHTSPCSLLSLLGSRQFRAPPPPPTSAATRALRGPQACTALALKASGWVPVPQPCARKSSLPPSEVHLREGRGCQNSLSQLLPRPVRLGGWLPPGVGQDPIEPLTPQDRSSWSPSSRGTGPHGTPDPQGIGTHRTPHPTGQGPRSPSPPGAGAPHCASELPPHLHAEDAAGPGSPIPPAAGQAPGASCHLLTPDAIFPQADGSALKLGQEPNSYPLYWPTALLRSLLQPHS